MEAKGMEGTVVADDTGITFHFKALNHADKKAGTGRTIPWAEISSVTFSRYGKFSTGYLRVNRVGETAIPKAAKDPQGLTGNVGAQADAMKLFADELADRLRGRSGAGPTPESKGTQRREIREARGQMSVKLGARRELRKLKGHLLPGEQVRYLASGVVERRQGLVALTDRRLLVLFHGHVRQSLMDLPLESVSSIREKTGVLMGKLTVLGSNSTLEISQVPKRDMKNLSQALRARISSGSLPPLPPIDLDEPGPGLRDPMPTTQPSGTPAGQLDQLERLVDLYKQGMLSEAEFTAAKADLLGSS